MDNEEKLGKMRYWMIGLFLIASGAITAILSIIPESSLGMIFTDINYWVMVGAIGVATVVLYFVYSMYLGKQ